MVSMMQATVLPAPSPVGNIRRPPLSPCMKRRELGTRLIFQLYDRHADDQVVPLQIANTALLETPYLFA
jgi:hypothetical protein